MSGGNVTIKNTAHASIIAKTAAVITITNVDYTLEEYNRFEKSLVTIARSVMSEHNGGQHGYAGVILRTAAYRKLVADTTAVFAPFTKPTRTPTYATTATTVEIKQAQEANAADREQFYTQEGVVEALKYLILSNTPAETLVELQDDDTDFENVTPLEMMEHLRTNARVTDVFDKKQLLDNLNAPIDFSGTLPLKGHFKNVDASIKLLKKHNVMASESIIMVTLLEQIKAHGEFKEDVSKWELLATASQTWTEFKKFYAAADHERRQREQYGAKTARSVGATVNHVTTVADLKAYIDDNLLALAQATTAGLNAVMETPTTAAPGKDKAEPNTMEDKIKALEAELKRMKNGNNSGGKSETKASKTKCTHCNRYHPKVPADKCWSLPGNQASKPEGWTVRTAKKE